MYRHFIVCVGILAAVACAPTEPVIDGPFVGLHVRGSVRTPGGEPVVGATLDVRARSLQSCAGGFADVTPTTSDATGAFNRTLRTWNVPQDVCIWIAVVPQGDASVAADTITVKPARLDLEIDTLEVAIVLPSRALEP